MITDMVYQYAVEYGPDYEHVQDFGDDYDAAKKAARNHAFNGQPAIVICHEYEFADSYTVDEYGAEES
jgi:hypothetical protein